MSSKAMGFGASSSVMSDTQSEASVRASSSVSSPPSAGAGVGRERDRGLDAGPARLYDPPRALGVSLEGCVEKGELQALLRALLVLRAQIRAHRRLARASGGLDRLEAVPGALLALRMLLSAGVRLEVVTSRPPVMRASTQALLEGLYGADVFSAMHFIGPGEKGLTCRNIGAVALVDDQLHNVVDAHSHGVQCVLFDLRGGYPWGARPEDVPPGVQRMENWSSTCLFLLSVAKEASRSAGARQKVDWMFQYMDARRHAWTAFAGFSG